MKKSYVALIVLLALSGLFLAFLRPVQVGGDTFFMVVYGGSMSPAINLGDIAVVKHSDDIGVDDVITFYDGGNSVTHRVVEVLPYGFLTKGDANNHTDIKPVYSNNVIGKVSFVLPYIGYVIHYAKSFWGLVFFIWIPGGALIAMFVKKLIKSIGSQEAS